MTEDEALKALKDYFKDHGIEQVVVLNVKDKENYLELQSLKPYGLFIINKITGEIDDNYGVFDMEENQNDRWNRWIHRIRN